MSSVSLFEPITLGPLTLANRVVLSPMTRARATADYTPTDMMVEYYRQRASAGLIISEGTFVSPTGTGWNHCGGLFEDAHVDGWRNVTDAVHRQGGRIVCQLWHTGRVTAASQVPEGRTLSSVSHQPPDSVVAHTGNGGEETPAAEAAGMTADDMTREIERFATATAMARDAGFDGVELHAANGYLIDQFLRDSVNSRDDEYGGSPENRVRFPAAVVEAIVGAWAAERVGVRVSPVGVYNAMEDSDPTATFSAFIDRLNDAGVCFLDVVEPPNPFDAENPGVGRPEVCNVLRERFAGAYIANGGYDRTAADAVLEANMADLVAFGRPFIANPDLPFRLQTAAPLAEGDHAKNYGGDAEGYIDYPTLASEQSPATA